MLRNPFVLKELWAGRRRQASQKAIAIGLLLPIAAVALRSIDGGWTAVACLWLAALGVQAVWSAAGGFAREREVGTLEVAALIPLPPLKEALVRWAGASLAAGCVWLLGLPLAFTIPAVGSLWGVLLWLFVGAWAAGLSAASFLLSCLVQRQPAVCAGVFALFGLSSLAANLAGVGDVGGFFAPLVLAQSSFDAAALSPSLAWTAIASATLAWTLGAACLLLGVAVLIERRSPHLAMGRPTVPRRKRACAARVSNPLYRSYLSRGTRTRDLLTLVAACAAAAALLHQTAHATASPTADNALMLLLAGSSLLALSAGTVVGSCAMSREINCRTLPLLVASGMRPGQIVTGKLQCGMHALALYTLAPLPAWIAAASRCGAPEIALLGLWAPLSATMGMLYGMSRGFSKAETERTCTLPQILAMAVLIPCGLLVAVPMLCFVGPLAFNLFVPVWSLELMLHGGPGGLALLAQALLAVAACAILHRLASGNLEAIDPL